MKKGDSIELQELNYDHWRYIFDQYDYNGDGFLNHNEFRDIINSDEYRGDIPQHAIDKIFELADQDDDGQLDKDEFNYIVTHPETKQFFEHLRNGVQQYVTFLVPQTPQTIGNAKGPYGREYSCWPPPVGMILISVIMLVLFLVDKNMRDDKKDEQGPITIALQSDPKRRKEAYRYFTYMFVHGDVMHLVSNMFLQLLLGIPLEMVHGFRVYLVYLAGVITGSLSTAILSQGAKLIGASGGVYSLLIAHIATVIMNWSQKKLSLIQLPIYLILIGVDVGFAIYMQNGAIGYAAQFSGAVAGLLFGIRVLRNIFETKFENWLQCIALVIYCILMGGAVWFNVYADYYSAKRHIKT